MTEILTTEQHTDALAVNLPAGRLWRAKWSPGSNLRGLLVGMASTMKQIDHHTIDQLNQEQAHLYGHR